MGRHEDYLGLLGGTYSVSGTGDTIDTWSGTTFNLAGGDDTVGLGGTGDYLGLLGGSGYDVNGSDDTIDTWSNTGLEVAGDGDVVNEDADSTFVDDGNNNVLNGVTVSVGDTYDTNNGDEVIGGDDPTGGYGYYGGYGFAGKQSTVNAALGSNIGALAQYDLSVGNQAGAAAAENALLQARAMAEATPTSGTGSAVDSGNKWDAGEVITWSIASDMASQYDAQVQQAFATWAAASGITFEEVSGSSNADIRVGFSDLGTASTGVAGYTTYQANGSLISDALIQLEDPDQDALVTGTNGQPTYLGTDATLEQVLLHEIGHALGLADDSDQNSIMYYELTSSNQTLDTTDISGIQSLYGSAGGTAQSGTDTTATGPSAGTASQITVAHQLNQLIAGIASFNPQSAGSTNLTHDDRGQHHMVVAASAH